MKSGRTDLFLCPDSKIRHIHVKNTHTLLLVCNFFMTNQLNKFKIPRRISNLLRNTTKRHHPHVENHSKQVINPGSLNSNKLAKRLWKVLPIAVTLHICGQPQTSVCEAASIENVCLASPSALSRKKIRAKCAS